MADLEYPTRIVDELLRASHNVIEQACEASIQGGRYGVSFRTVFDFEKLTATTEAWVDPDVPYGYKVDRTNA